ncbi:MAG: HAMP domain-containing sensor histidine kinase [Clostridiales bacterium]|nr:HAMP domain-containing sensor histidine kinase [Clostridiales bacterium]
MFKKLRNRMLLVNMLIIGALILGSFSAIYTVISQNTFHNIEQRLDRAAGFARMQQSPRQGEPQRRGTQKPSPEEGQKFSFEPTIALTIDETGEIIAKSSDWNMEEADEEQLAAAAKQIMKSEKKHGSITMMSARWDYKLFKEGGVYIAAMGQFATEHRMLYTLLIAFCLGGAAVMAAAFFISLNISNRSIRPIEESYNRQKQFIADASHELKTPLTTINTNVDVLLSHKDSTIGEEQKWLYYIKGEAQRMSRLTDDLLYLAKLNHDENEIFSRVSFSDNAESVILAMEAVAFEKNILIEDNIAPEVYVNASDTMLKQLMMILLDNAIKYTPPAGKISVVLTSEGVLRVRNTGEGISEEDQKRIFERFYRSDKSRARESGGYGLGLAIANAICTRFGGSIWVSSVLGEFTEFTVKLDVL